FSLLISVIPALLPAVGLKALNLNSSHLGILFTSMAAGALFGAVVLVPRVRERLTPNQVTILASLLLIVVYILMAVVRNLEIFMLVAALAGGAWTLAGSELWVVAQQAMPGWTRGRLNAAQLMISQGGIALGGLAWGSLAAFTGFQYTLILATLLVCYNLSVTGPLSLDVIKTLDVEPAAPPPTPTLDEPPGLDDGPIAVVVDITADKDKRNHVVQLARALRLAYLRNGASSVRLYESLADRSVFRFEAVLTTWREHELLQRRLTKTEREILDHLLRMHTGNETPIYHYLLITKEISTPRQT
ncbi:MAG: MFS transporter, partial [Verrucomicrobia bacterium]|nr:MFS transporter [Verrucomicrobiota bacterium]